MEGNKLAELKAAGGTMGKICSHVASGGSVLDLCTVWGVAYGDLMVWINEDDQRFKEMARALDSQMAWAMEKVILELKLIGTVDLAGAYDELGRLKNLQDIPEDVRRCISSVDVFEEFEGVGNAREQIGVTKKVKLFDKIKALELIGKRFAMWIDRARVDVNVKTLEDLIVESMAPVAAPGSKPEILDATVLPNGDGPPDTGETGGPRA